MKKFFFLLLSCVLLFSCARIGSPIGGKKDSIAPKFLSSNLDKNTTKVSRNLHELRLNFNEYVTLKDISKNLIISPPLKITKIIPSNLANKTVIVQWKDTLQANTTYSFNFGNAIQDYTESNPLPYFNYAFSTGDKIDQLYISGTVKNALIPEKKAIKPVENKFVVGLYKQKDSINYKQKPYYIAKVDPDGYFELNYLTPGKYKIIAFNDENLNSIFDTGKEDVGFFKEPLELTENISGKEIKLYPTVKPVKFSEIKPNKGGVLLTFDGNPKEVNLKSINDNLKDYQISHITRSDSANVWFNPNNLNLSTNQSVKLEFGLNADALQDSVSVFYKTQPKDEMTVFNENGSLLPPKKEMTLNSNYYINKIQPENWTLVSDSLNQKFTAKISEENPFKILISADFKPGKKYQLTIPKETVRSFYNANAVSKLYVFEMDKEENYGTLTVNLENQPQHPFWIQLIDEKGIVLYSIKTNLNTIKFTEIKPATYFVRILVDNNQNGIWDKADLQTNTLAEEVYLYHKELPIRALWEIVENWNLKSEPEPKELPVKTPIEKPKEMPITAPKNK